MWECKVCNYARQAKYRKPRREKLAAKQRTRYAADIEKSRAKGRAKRETNGDRIRALEMAWRGRNAARVNQVRSEQQKARYRHHANNITYTYAAISLNRNRPVYIGRREMPRELVEAKQLELKIRNHIGATT